MIDTASILARRYKDNRAQLTAALMGQPVQDPELDAYSALRAMQLLKESDRMAMAQQARGPSGDQPSLMQEAVTPEQPQGLAAMVGQPIMAQAPQQAPEQPMQAASGGLASMPTPDHDYAEGGIVALASGGRPSSADYLEKAFANIPQPTSLSEREAGMTAQRDYVDKLYGADRMAPYIEEIAKEKQDIEGRKDKNLGYALLAAAQGIVSDPNMARAAGKAMGAFGSEMQKLEKEDREAKRALRQSEMTLAAAQQARADGKTDKAISLYDKYDTQRRDAQKMLSEVNVKSAEIEAGREKAELAAQVDRERNQITKAGQERPGEIERMVADYERRLGRKLSADELKDAIGEFSEARGGYRYTGPEGSGNKDIAKFTKQFNDVVAIKQMQKSMPGITPDKIAQLDREIEDERKKYVTNVQRIKDELGGGSNTAAAASGARSPSSAAVSALKANPDKRAEFDAYYGPGSAAKILGG